MRERLQKLRERIEQACEKAKRDPKTVNLVAVSKGHQIVRIKEAYDLGLRDFGENYAVEMSKKMSDPQLLSSEIRWHFIGHIQSNKLRSIASASVVQTLAEVAHAEALSRLLPAERTIQAFLQVNLANEQRRSGVFLENVFERYAQMMKMPRLNLCGLMTIAPIGQEHKPAFWFEQMQSLRRELEQKIGVAVPQLSMGMSGDFEEAILYGATWIRVGTLLFGEREMKSND